MVLLTLWLVSVLVSLTVTESQTSLPHDDVLVRMNHGGQVRGTILRSEKGMPFYAFRGIPYAEPPLGPLRFKPPVEKVTWAATGILDATKDGSSCPQILRNNKTIIGNEDCLLLNVYTPKLQQNGFDDKAVMIFIHGGGFDAGSGISADYPPERFMDSDIVLVIINYRLGALGFLSTADASSPGNYGLLDQTLALQWVKDNIKAFGGNPDSVTIFGESSGGVSVAYHLISTKSNGLFHRAIEMSGTSLSLYALKDNPLFWAQKLALQTNCPQTNTSDMVECLRGKSFEELLTVSATFTPIPFPPTVDGQFFTAHPRELLRDCPSKINNVPVLSGCTGMEGAGTVDSVKQAKPNASVISEGSFEYAFNNSFFGYDSGIAQMVREHYLKSVDISNEFEANKTLAKAFSDGASVMNHYEEVQYLSKAGLDVYLYSYDYATVNVPGRLVESRKYGVGHGEDLISLFNMTWFGVIPLEENDYKMVDLMTELWSNFAKTGHPDPMKKYQPQWKTSSPDLFHIYHLNLTITEEDYDIENDDLFRFWTQDVAAARRKNI